MEKMIRDFVKVRWLRVLLVRIRLFWAVRVRHSLTEMQSSASFSETVRHNLRGLRHCNDRIALLVRPLSVVESWIRDGRTLVVGPRNEHDLFMLWAYGANWGGLKGLDLITYSPKIDLGDVHAIPYSDAEFDTVVCGWTLSYSADPQRAMDELMRVLKPGGLIALGVEYSNIEPGCVKDILGYAIQETNRQPQRINSTADLRKLLRGRIDTVIFEHDAPRKKSHGPDGFVSDVSNVALIAQLRAAQ